MLLRKIHLAARIQAGGRPAASSLRRVAPGLHAEGQPLAQVPLNQPAQVAPVTIPRARIPPPSIAAVSGPRPPAFLRPHRQVDLRVSASQPLSGVAGGNLHQRENADLRKRAGLVDEAVLDPHFDIAHAALRRRVRRPVESVGDDDVELGILQDAVVELDGRPDSRDAAGNAPTEREEVSLQVAQVHRLRVVGFERWAGVHRHAHRPEE